MSTNIDAIEPAAADMPDADLPEYSPKMDLVYLKVAGILVVLTALEIYASYSDYLGKFFLPLMLLEPAQQRFGAHRFHGFRQRFFLRLLFGRLHFVLFHCSSLCTLVRFARRLHSSRPRTRSTLRG
jgi:hypothetical protein